MHVLKKARKRSPLTLDDVRMLLKQKSWGTLSRVENGKRYPSLEMVVCYHVLFAEPLEVLLKREIEEFRLFLEGYAEARIDEITYQSNGVDLAERIHFLSQFTEDGKN
ncbi:MAG: helix-turn-helix domain-containing protein [bacterium]|nr:helix-turn-helix domain-containing protein [bacterium]